MSNKLFYNSPYIKEWDTKVIEAKEMDGKHVIVLEDTAFYPEGGGQPADKGSINEAQVLDVFEDNGVIYHVVDKLPLDGEVHCILDYSRRFDHMQQHSGQHLLSAVFYELYKGETSSFHLGNDLSIDISLSEVSDEMIKIIEEKVNELILKNLDLKTYIVDYDKLGELPLRKYPKVHEDIRIVEIDKYDYSPCCGTHVTKTGEIVLIKIVKTEKYKGVTRIYFKCGRRAFEDYQNKNDIVISLSRGLSVDENSITGMVNSNIQQIKDLGKEIKTLKEKLSTYEAMDIIKAKNNNIIVKSFEDKTFEDVQFLSRSISEAGEYIMILSSITDKKLLFANSSNKEIKCGKIFKENLAVYNGKGGGSDKSAQAGFNDIEDLHKFEEFLKSAF